MSIKEQMELDRLRSLESYDILDTLPEEAFDDLTLLASSICETPIAAVSLIDKNRQWFKSRIGLEVSETPRDIAFCHHAIQDPDNVLNVQDALQDERFATNPLVLDGPGIRFYAGVPLVAVDGYPLGTLCVIDTRPRSLSEDQLKALRALGRTAVTQLEIRKTNQELVRRNDELGQFAYRVSHDFKAPLSSVKSLSNFLISDVETGNLEELKPNALRIKHQMQKLESFVEDMLDLARSDLADEVRSEVDLEALVQELFTEQAELIDSTGVQVTIDISAGLTVTASKVRLHQILGNLLSNSLKYYNSKRKEPFVKIAASASSYSLEMSVSDNGLGIPSKYHEHVGKMFRRFHPQVSTGSGLGLAIVFKQARAMGASVQFETGETGTSFRIHVPLGEATAI